MGGGVADANGYEFIDLGLSVLWATRNIGASKPTNYGLFFQWAGTKGYSNVSELSGGFVRETAPYYKGPGTYSGDALYKKYITDSRYGTKDDKKVLELEDDAAHIIMGGDWRIPTKEECNELGQATIATKGNTQLNTNYGVTLTLKNDESKQIYFPAAGYYEDTTHYAWSVYSRCWTSSIMGYGDNVYYMGCSANYTDKGAATTSEDRYVAMPIRAVLPRHK